MTQTVLVFLKSYLSKERFAEALAWIKGQDQTKRVFLPGVKLWVLDIETTIDDPQRQQALDRVTDQGWTIVGTTLWDVSIPLRGSEAALTSLAELAVAPSHTKRTITPDHRARGN